MEGFEPQIRKVNLTIVVNWDMHKMYESATHLIALCWGSETR